MYIFLLVMQSGTLIFCLGPLKVKIRVQRSESPQIQNFIENLCMSLLSYDGDKYVYGFGTYCD